MDKITMEIREWRIRMKKNILCIVICLSSILYGCALQNLPKETVMTQEVMTQSIATQAAETVMPDSNSDSSSISEEDRQKRLYYVKAQQEAIEIEIEELESQFRVGMLEEDLFRQRKSDLQSENMLYDKEEDELEFIIGKQSKRDLPSGSAEELLTQLEAIEWEYNRMEEMEDNLEQEYRMETLSKADYVEKQAELMKQKEELDEQADLLEDALELKGWDD